MKQPDTAALRERLANYTPQEEQEQDTRELEGLLQETNSRIEELRALVEEIHALTVGLIGIVTNLTNVTADMQKKRSIGAQVHPDTIKALNEVCTDFVVNVGKQLMAHRDRQLELQKEHEKRIVRMLERNRGVWLSDGWITILLIVQFLCYFAVVLWGMLK